MPNCTPLAKIWSKLDEEAGSGPLEWCGIGNATLSLARQNFDLLDHGLVVPPIRFEISAN